jgi:hypothetical protein
MAGAAKALEEFEHAVGGGKAKPRPRKSAVKPDARAKPGVGSPA